jgi:hypothetical protein
VNVPGNPRPDLSGASVCFSADAPARFRSSAGDPPHLWRAGRAQIALIEILMGWHCELARRLLCVESRVIASTHK